MPDSAGVPIQVIINSDGSVTNTSAGGQGEGTLADWIDDFTKPDVSSLANYRDLGGQSWEAQGAQIMPDGSGLAGALGSGDWLFSPSSFDDANGNCRLFESIQMLQVGSIASVSPCNVLGHYVGLRSSLPWYVTRSYMFYTGSPPGATQSQLTLDHAYNGHFFSLGSEPIGPTGSSTSEAGYKNAPDWWFITVMRAGVIKCYCVKNAGTTSSGVGGDPLGIGTNDFDNSFKGPDLAANFVGAAVNFPSTGGSGSSQAETGVSTWQQDFQSWMPGRVGLWMSGLGPNDRIKKYRCIPLSYRNPVV